MNAGHPPGFKLNIKIFSDLEDTFYFTPSLNGHFSSCNLGRKKNSESNFQSLCNITSKACLTFTTSETVKIYGLTKRISFPYLLTTDAHSQLWLNQGFFGS